MGTNTNVIKNERKDKSLVKCINCHKKGYYFFNYFQKKDLLKLVLVWATFTPVTIAKEDTSGDAETGKIEEMIKNGNIDLGINLT